MIEEEARATLVATQQGGPMNHIMSTLDEATSLFGYAAPSARAQASEDQFLLLDSMEAGLARASMSMAGCGRLGALIRVEGPEIDQESLVAAVATLRQRHALLRRTLKRTRLGLALAPCDVASFVSVTVSDADDGWREAWREIEALPLLEGSPLVSVYVLKQASDPRRADLLLVIEHIISDGASLVSLAKEILEIIAPSVRSEVGPTNCVERFPPTVVTMAKARLGGAAREVAGVWKALTRLAAWDFENPHVRLRRKAGTRIAACHTHVTYRDLDPDFYESLFVHARREKASVPTITIAALALALAEREYRNGYARAEYNVLPHVTVDLRSRYTDRLAHGDLGVHVSTIDPLISISAARIDEPGSALLFDLARTLRADMQELMRAGVDRHFLGTLVAGAGILLPRLAPEQSFGSFIFTDAASFPVPSQLGGFDVHSASALANCRGQSQPYVATTRSARQTRISMMAPTPAFAVADIEALLDATVERLMRVITPS